ncbi:hypothetical protein AWB75_04069 [Caballeronia catudaia]|uniref:3-deoxy-D-arabino-heptulosonate 7-phosphate synthase n=1 Tax=Caballeronia catudaia TaxID=1777136 RepID=A0A158BX31_9BURK|nr:hypothetical protein [Caballeronia catudaia]SAK73817.1 hypothetical protein AWB75_04069 [Caballeronia catudaia]
MLPMPSLRLLADTLHAVARRYRLPPLDAIVSRTQDVSAPTALALVIEEARKVIESGGVPDDALKRRFIEALARVIRDAMRPDAGDPAFQAVVLRQHAETVREYAALSAQAGQDRRLVRAAITTIAHPRKQERMRSGAQREALARLFAAASSVPVSETRNTVECLLHAPEITSDASLLRALTQLRDSAALERLLRLETLEPDQFVRRYRSLWDRNGPRPGSATAVAQGVEAQRRGADAEASAARALEALAQRLNEDEGQPASYRVVTSMRVPASLAAGHARAKTEWDAALLRRAPSLDSAPAWDVCLLVEAKASVDAATTDFGRLLRGLRLLARADEDAAYAFETREGVVHLRGASLSALRTDEAALEQTVLYCCDASDDTALRPLSAAGRMRLMTAPASLEYASTLTRVEDLEPVWNAMLQSPQWAAVLDQYPALRQVRELMVHPDDLLAAIRGAANQRDVAPE